MVLFSVAVPCFDGDIVDAAAAAGRVARQGGVGQRRRAKVEDAAAEGGLVAREGGVGQGRRAGVEDAAAVAAGRGARQCGAGQVALLPEELAAVAVPPPEKLRRPALPPVAELSLSVDVRLTSSTAGIYATPLAAAAVTAVTAAPLSCRRRRRRTAGRGVATECGVGDGDSFIGDIHATPLAAAAGTASAPMLPPLCRPPSPPVAVLLETTEPAVRLSVPPLAYTPPPWPLPPAPPVTRRCCSSQGSPAPDYS